jgi:hypothetical protein
MSEGFVWCFLAEEVMSDRPALPHEADPGLKMRDANCASMEYQIEVPLDKFDLDAFRLELGAASDATGESRVCNTKNPNVADYHVHFRWRLREKRAAIEFEIDYVATSTDPAQDEKEPFAENVMSWLGRFSKFGDISAKVSADFRYKGPKHLIAFPLPLKITLAEMAMDAEIDGLSFSLPSQPSGINRVFVSRTSESLYLGIQSERRVSLGTFSVADELRLASEMAEKFVR